ncbi:hypothetical protein [Pseudonocardia broussonetiae]|nr:hypothetical protein [Pseudonocardia broussonetiae]
MARTRSCTPEVRRGRQRKAEQFLDAAALLHDLTAHPARSATPT